jgi:hypothetical protein
MLQARFGPGLRRLAIVSAVALVAVIAAMSVGVSESRAMFSLSGGCEIHENFCTDIGGGDGAPSGTGWGVSGGGSSGSVSGGGGGWSVGADGGTLTEVARGTTICRFPNGESFACEYSDYRAPNGSTIRQCYWSEFGVRKESIPCG